MISKHYLLILAVTGASFLKAKDPVKFVVTGDIQGLGNDSVVLIYEDQGKRERIESIARNDHFELGGEVPSMRIGYIYFGGVRSQKSTYLVLDDGRIYLKGNIQSPDDIVISGTRQNLDLFANRQGEMVFYNRMKPLAEKLRSKPDKESEQKLQAQIEALRDSVRLARIRFNESHPGSLASLMNLWVLQDQLDIPTLEKLYNSLAPELKGIGFAPDIKAKIEARKRVAIGSPAPEFITKDLQGNTVSLATFKGKYVLLDFWASWCVPCREENPYLKSAYQKFKEKGFQILSISIDEDRNKWLEAVSQDSLPWVQVLEGPWVKDGIARRYSVQPIPDNFLIDPEGRIIARGLRGEQLEKAVNAALQKGTVRRD